MVRTTSGRKVKGPKSEAGKGSVAVPPHLMPVVKAHLREHAAMGCDGLLFPAQHGEQFAPSTLHRVYYPAWDKAGRPDLRFHDPQGGTGRGAAQPGHQLGEGGAGGRGQHGSGVARYQHGAKDRDRVIAAALSKLVTGDLTPVEAAGKKLPRRQRSAS